MLSFFMFQFQERTVLSHMLLSKNRGKKVHFVKILLVFSGVLGIFVVSALFELFYI